MAVDDMRVVSVNVGREESIEHGKRTFRTGIRKRPADGAVYIGSDSVAGDTISDKEHHGGADQVVYAYSADDYEWWSEQLGRELAPGTFGDNLTIEGLPTDMNVGDRLLIGDVLLEATAPRIPCSTLAAQMQDSGFGMAFRKAERPGIYFRVLNEGDISAGEAVTFIENPTPVVSILQLYRLAYDLRPDPAALESYLEAPLAERLRASIEEKLSSQR
ncbi:MAG: MOSC domain-containing protein [Gammaproteobacteria bacterium]|nr:MOSC domain-containing protein [Gammaproteobacteria bacterium]NIT16577.1 MOSC domain-containing protein [Gammaproteobacteria bacterium]